MELLQGIRDACQKYKDKYFDKKNLNKNDDVKELLKKVEMEEKGKAYEANLKGGKFTTLTRSGRDAVKGIEPKHRGFAQQHKLSNAESVRTEFIRLRSLITSIPSWRAIRLGSAL